MTMDVSRMGIVVESTGIKEATTALWGRGGKGGLAGAAEKAEKNVTSLSASMGKLMNMQATASTAALAAAMGQLGTAMSAVAQQANQVAASLSNATNGMNTLGNATQRAARENEGYARGSHVVMNTIKALATVSTVYAAINVAGSIIKQADAWQMMQARLQNATGSLNNAKVAQNDMYELSMKLRVPLEDQVRLYTRMAPSMQRMGKSAEETKNVVEGVATALQLSGANGAEMSSVMTQLSQSFGSGVLNGAEFTAVAENGAAIMQALEEHTGKSKAELKKLGSDGKLSIHTVNDAILAALPKWREQFENLPVTFEGGIQRIQNAWTKAIGEMGQDTKFNRELSQALRIVEDMIPVVTRGLAEAFVNVMNWIKENKKVLGEVWNQIYGLGSDAYEVSKAFASWIGALMGAGEEVSIVSAAIFGIRFVLAAIIDGVKTIGWAFANVGLDVAQFFLTPVVWVFEKIGDINAAIGNLFAMAAEGARAFGNNELADKLSNAASSARNTAYSALEIADNIKNLVNAGRESSDKWIEGIKNGTGALGTLLSETKKVTKETEKFQGVMDGSWKQGKPQTPEDEKAAKAAERERKHFDDAMVQAQAMKKEQEELNKRLEDYGLAYEKLGPAQKKVIELTEQQARLEKDHASAVVIAHNLALLKVYEEAAALEKKNEHLKESLQLQEKILNAQGATTKSVQDEATKAEGKLAQYGEPKGVDQLLEIKRVKESIAELDATSDGSRTANLEVMIAMLQQELEARERIYDAESALGQLQVEDQFQKLMDPKKAEKFGDALANGFGKAGKALGDLVKGMQSYEARMSKVGKAWELVNKQTDPMKKAKMSAQAADLEQEAWVSTYADMAGAAKGFFEEGSRGFKAMEAVEKGFRAWQMAMQLKSFLQEIGLIQAVTTAKVVGNETSAASAVAASSTEVAASMAAGSASAVAGVANQAQGDPYTAFFRMAAMAAIMAALGFAVGGLGGGGGKSVSATRQASQGTGTVLGDDDAKSESIVKSLEYLSENSDIALRHSSGMLSSLRNIEASLTGVTNAIVRNGGNITGRDFEGSKSGPSFLQGEAFLGGLTNLPIIGDFLGKISGFGSSKKLKDSGITSDMQSIGDILNGGFQGSTYQDVETTKKAFFISYSKKTSRDKDDLSADVEQEFTNVIEGMVNTITEAGEALGFSAEEVKARLEAVNISLGDISLKGLSAEEIQAQLEAVFSAFGDQLVTAGLGQAVTGFQQAGEGLLETAVRVASGVEQAGYELEKLGLTAIDFSAIINKNGDVGAEIVRQSILMEEAGTGVGEIIEQLGGTAADIASVYKDLVDVRGSLSMLGIAEDVTRELIRAAGGLDAMKEALASYTDNFFSDAEKNAMQASALSKEFDKLGLTMPTTKDGFRALVEQLSATGADGQELAMKVLLLSDAFADLMDNSAAAVEDARNNLADAYERESQALIDTKEKFEDFAESLSKFKTDLITGDLSTENPLQKYMTLKAQYEDVATRAAAGDESAMADFESIAQAFLNASRDVYASGDQYTSDFQRVLDQTTALEQDAAGKASVAQQQLDALNQQVSGLLTINESVLTVAEAIAALQEVMASGLGIEVDGSHANGLASVPYDGYIAELHKGERVLTAEENRSYPDYSSYGSGNTTALVEEIKNLRQEVKNLRDGQREQTGALIAANYDASERNAQIVVEGQQDAARTSTYSERAKTGLV